jgi:hypothetical protein
VRYTVTAPAVDTHHCHCNICRKFHGPLFVTLSIFPRNAFTYDKGTGNLGTYNSSDKVHRHFCKTCGCPISLDLVENPDVIAVATGTIDNGQWPGFAHQRTAPCVHTVEGGMVRDRRQAASAQRAVGRASKRVCLPLPVRPSIFAPM